MLHKALEGAIILESFPKTTVDVFALVLESGGSKFEFFFWNQCRRLFINDLASGSKVGPGLGQGSLRSNSQQE
jgi:hypothetical protein